MKDRDETIALIVPPATQSAQEIDRLGGEETGFKETLQNVFSGVVPVEKSDLKASLHHLLSNLREVIGDVSSLDMKDWRISDIEIGLTINAEGTVGIATAGMESSLKIKYTRNRLASPEETRSSQSSQDI
jgi:hypothetical protein